MTKCAHRRCRGESSDGGYAALMAVIVLGAVLLAAVARASAAGWYARTQALDAEAQMQARTLADSCAEQALSRLLSDPSYRDATTDIFPSGSCTARPPVPDTPSTGLVTITAQSIIRGFAADITVVVRPDVACATGATSTALQIVSWKEAPSL